MLRKTGGVLGVMEAPLKKSEECRGKGGILRESGSGSWCPGERTLGGGS